jgi:hypothetical protein
MPDTPFCGIDPWARSPREATRVSAAGDDVRHLTAELRRLRHELRAVGVREVTPKETESVRRPRVATRGHTEGGSHGE